jgi:hypothetical protein
MARAGSRIGAALGLRQAPGVVPAAFDQRLDGAFPDSFVYSCLDNGRLELVTDVRPVSNLSTQPARMTRIVPGARVRGDLERWASGVVCLSGGELRDAAAHPDAGRVWSFGSYKQRLTDAVDFTCHPATMLRFTQGSVVKQYVPAAELQEDLWVVSAAVVHGPQGAPTEIEHSHVAFEFLAEGDAVLARCDDASGREVPVSELPCDHTTRASASEVATARFPPFTELCYIIWIGR